MPQVAYKLAPDPTNPPTFGWTALNRPYFIFDDTTDQLLMLTGQIPEEFDSNFSYVAKYAMASATSNVVAIRDESMAVADGEDVDTDNLGSVNDSGDVTVPGTADLQDTIETVITGTFAAGDYFAVRLGRENATSGTNATGDMHIFDISLIFDAA